MEVDSLRYEEDTKNGSIKNGKASQGNGEFQLHIEQYSNHWTAVMTTVFRTILEKLNPAAVEDSEVVKFCQPQQLMEQFDFALQDHASMGLKDFMTLCEDIVDKSVKTMNPLFRNQLFGGMDAFGLAAAILAEALNTSAYTYDVAPVFSLMEREVVDQLCQMCGFKDGDGISCPGGSISNMYGINLARFIRDKSVKQKGMFGESRLVIYTSIQSHYSIQKGAAFMGFGTDSIVTIECDHNGSILPKDLVNKIEKTIAEGKIPMMVICTSGTTVLNGFDPVDEIANICQMYKLWMHVDACVGGAFLITPKYKEKIFKGIHRADSVCLNWHKLPGAPQQTAMFLCAHKGLLKEAHRASAHYLFHAEKHYDTSYDKGDASIQCGRKPDAFKIWLMWKARGLKEIGRRIEETCAVAEYMVKRLSTHPRFRLVMPQAQGSAVCFWVIPPRIARNYKKDSAEYWKEVDGVALKLKTRMVNKGLSLITYQPLPDKGLANFFRCTLTCHPPFTTEHVESAIDIMVSLCDDL